MIYISYIFDRKKHSYYENNNNILIIVHLTIMLIAIINSKTLYIYITHLKIIFMIKYKNIIKKLMKLPKVS